MFNETNSVKVEWPNINYYNDSTCQDLSLEYQYPTQCSYNYDGLSADDDNVLNRVVSYNTYYNSSLQYIPFSPTAVPSNDNNSLSTVDWIGIVIGCAIGVGLIVGIFVYCVLMPKTNKYEQTMLKENELNKI